MYDMDVSDEQHCLCAGSDGRVRVFRWHGGGDEGAAEALLALEAHAYPALACDFGAGGALLLSAGLDASACLWDVQVAPVFSPHTQPQPSPSMSKHYHIMFNH